MLSKIETLIHARTKTARNWLRKWESQIARALLTGDYRPDGKGGIILFDDKVARGEFFFRPRHDVNELVFAPNNVVDQGIMKALGVMFYSDAKIANWYLTLHNGSTTPPDTLTAANYAATMGEITSSSEGFSNATRPVWTPNAPVANTISNTGNEATFEIVATTSIEATGSALISSDVRGGTSGTLWAASIWPDSRDLFNGESFDLGYQTSLAD